MTATAALTGERAGVFSGRPDLWLPVVLGLAALDPWLIELP